MDENDAPEMPLGLKIITSLTSLTCLALMGIGAFMLVDLRGSLLGIANISNLAEFFALLALLILLAGLMLGGLAVATFRARRYAWPIWVVLLSLFVIDGLLGYTGMNTMAGSAVLGVTLAYMLLPRSRAFFRTSRRYDYA